VRLALRAWKGATPAERAEFVAAIAPELREMIREEVRAALAEMEVPHGAA
jgi:acyl-CoA reductase-like NAD-dependent aldehyde dehydrogenase